MGRTYVKNRHILIIGKGGREHALAELCLQHTEISKVWVAPGNGGMFLSPCIYPALINFENKKELMSFVQEKKISLIIVGPEQPLTRGFVDRLKQENILILGPTKELAQLESSKLFAKKVMKSCKIPTASYEAFSEVESAYDFIDKTNWNGYVIKADDLQAGKGVLVCSDKQSSKKAVYRLLQDKDYPIKTKSILIEKRLLGREISAFVLSNGDSCLSLGYACDYKRLLEKNLGPNTGGMGAFTPVPWLTNNHKNFIQQSIFQPIIDYFKNRQTPYKGFLFAGLMIHDNQVSVIEFNVRLGDPEAQVLLPLMDPSLVDQFFFAAGGKNFNLHSSPFKNSLSAVHVVMASGGYPGTEGAPISQGDIVSLDLPTSEDYKLFFAGIRQQNEQFITAGGRVLGVTGIDQTIKKARKKAYQYIKGISFKNSRFRKDIGL